MEVIVGTRHLLASTFTALDLHGREHLVIVAKASWRVPLPGQRPQPLPPSPLVPADLHVGEPGVSAMLYGSDFVRHKPRCDVLFDASAHSPGGQPVRELPVVWQVGPLKKGLRVLGPRIWRKRLGRLGLSRPEPFTRQPLHYGLAYGGTREYETGKGDKKQVLTEALLSNPVGLGWAGKHTLKQLDGAPAPSLESLEQPIRKPGGPYEPVACSAVGRHWLPRRDYAGTYDAQWQEEVFPLLPADFDERFNQCAPLDQQMDYPRGGEPVVLRNMLPDRDDVRFVLPRLDGLKLRVLRTDYSVEEPSPVVDTLYFELDDPDGPRFSAIWRASVPIRRRIQEFDTVALGPVNSQWWRDKVLGLGSGGCAGCGASPAPTEQEALPT
ncbi:hypothetical protein GCM10007860_22150 [Chitiniphilus shinanonensis]|uniref:DUF2169 domain-containing protein n=1 Tax=Chitiniphilus shinanonensis TaxID=553088 RepID=A0ABQ6BST4_9NEIS|nr:DUF2169 domain-containing protein [Chitiniphilus shinanonensis]GLS05065.1 hypothetical protein GCM10007860_22150 [Chitiniphilus shinanonensis]